MKEKIKKIYNKISYAIIPFFIFVAVLGVSYLGNQFLYSWGVTKGSNYPEIPLDSQIPLIAWFVYPYFLTFPLGLFTFFYLAYKDKKAFYNVFITLIISFAISGVIYLFGQTVFTKPDFEPVTFTDKFVVWTWGATNPVNCFPSQHCFMAFAMIIACLTAKEEKMNIFFKIFTITCDILIVLATVFIRQHFLLDIFASFIIMFSAFAVCYVFKWGEKLMQFIERKQEIRKQNKLKKEQEKDENN